MFILCGILSPLFNRGWFRLILLCEFLHKIFVVFLFRFGQMIHFRQVIRLKWTKNYSINCAKRPIRNRNLLNHPSDHINESAKSFREASDLLVELTVASSSVSSGSLASIKLYIPYQLVFPRPRHVVFKIRPFLLGPGSLWIGLLL